jgi:prepilin-type N-terminal cleavage/methylation domain-containing protein
MTSICCRGFTLIELVITMVMMGILSAVVVTDISARAQHSVTTQADQFRRNLSHLQLLAISRGARLRLTVAAGGGGYSVATCATSACTTRSALVDPATGLNFSVTLTDGVTLSPAGNILDFDSMGRQPDHRHPQLHADGQWPQRVGHGAAGHGLCPDELLTCAATTVSP